MVRCQINTTDQLKTQILLYEKIFYRSNEYVVAGDYSRTCLKNNLGVHGDVVERF